MKGMGVALGLAAMSAIASTVSTANYRDYSREFIDDPLEPISNPFFDPRNDPFDDRYSDGLGDLDKPPQRSPSKFWKDSERRIHDSNLNRPVPHVAVPKARHRPRFTLSSLPGNLHVSIEPERWTHKEKLGVNEPEFPQRLRPQWWYWNSNVGKYVNKTDYLDTIMRWSWLHSPIHENLTDPNPDDDLDAQKLNVTSRLNLGYTQMSSEWLRTWALITDAWDHIEDWKFDDLPRREEQYSVLFNRLLFNFNSSSGVNETCKARKEQAYMTLSELTLIGMDIKTNDDFYIKDLMDPLHELYGTDTKETFDKAVGFIQSAQTNNTSVLLKQKIDVFQKIFAEAYRYINKEADQFEWDLAEDNRQVFDHWRSESRIILRALSGLDDTLTWHQCKGNLDALSMLVLDLFPDGKVLKDRFKPLMRARKSFLAKQVWFWGQLQEAVRTWSTIDTARQRPYWQPQTLQKYRSAKYEYDDVANPNPPETWL